MTTLADTLLKIRGQFAFYAEQHHAKGTADGTAKALVNEKMAALCDATLADLPQTPFNDQAAFMLACGQTVLTPNPVQAAMYRKLIKEEYEDELLKAFDEEDEVEQADAVMDLIVVLIGFAFSKGWPVSKLWAEVIRSNMAKVDPATGLVRKREDGKVLKPEGWTAPDIAGVLAGRL